MFEHLTDRQNFTYKHAITVDLQICYHLSLLILFYFQRILEIACCVSFSSTPPVISNFATLNTTDMPQFHVHLFSFYLFYLSSFIFPLSIFIN